MVAAKLGRERAEKLSPLIARIECGNKQAIAEFMPIAISLGKPELMYVLTRIPSLDLGYLQHEICGVFESPLDGPTVGFEFLANMTWAHRGLFIEKELTTYVCRHVARIAYGFPFLKFPAMGFNGKSLLEEIGACSSVNSHGSKFFTFKDEAIPAIAYSTAINKATEQREWKTEQIDSTLTIRMTAGKVSISIANTGTVIITNGVYRNAKRFYSPLYYSPYFHDEGGLFYDEEGLCSAGFIALDSLEHFELHSSRILLENYFNFFQGYLEQCCGTLPLTMWSTFEGTTYQIGGIHRSPRFKEFVRTLRNAFEAGYKVNLQCFRWQGAPFHVQTYMHQGEKHGALSIDEAILRVLELMMEGESVNYSLPEAAQVRSFFQAAIESFGQIMIGEDL